MANAATATFSGRSVITNRIKGNGTEPKNISWGDASTTGAANPNVALFKPQTEARVVGTSALITTSQLADTYQVTGSIVCAVGAKTITEMGLHDSTTASPSTTVAASMTASATTVTLGVASGVTGNAYRQIENETVLITGGANSTLETITRGALGSTAAVHSSGVTTTLGGDGGAGTGGATSGQTATVGAAQGGSIFVHADFAGIALSVSDSIAGTFNVQLT